METIDLYCREVVVCVRVISASPKYDDEVLPLRLAQSYGNMTNDALDRDGGILIFSRSEWENLLASLTSQA